MLFAALVAVLLAPCVNIINSYNEIEAIAERLSLASVLQRNQASLPLWWDLMPISASEDPLQALILSRGAYFTAQLDNLSRYTVTKHPLAITPQGTALVAKVETNVIFVHNGQSNYTFERSILNTVLSAARSLLPAQCQLTLNKLSFPASTEHTGAALVKQLTKRVPPSGCRAAALCLPLMLVVSANSTLIPTDSHTLGMSPDPTDLPRLQRWLRYAIVSEKLLTTVEQQVPSAWRNDSSSLDAVLQDVMRYQHTHALVEELSNLLVSRLSMWQQLPAMLMGGPKSVFELEAQLVNLEGMLYSCRHGSNVKGCCQTTCSGEEALLCAQKASLNISSNTKEMMALLPAIQATASSLRAMRAKNDEVTAMFANMHSDLVLRWQHWFVTYGPFFVPMLVPVYRLVKGFRN